MNLLFGQQTRMLANQMWREVPVATALLKGDTQHAGLQGKCAFYPFMDGSLVVYEFFGLPKGDGSCDLPIFAMHIHENGSCTGSAADPFENVGAHYDPAQCPHPFHAGDLPPVFGNYGYAWGAFYTARFRPSQVIGRAVILHDAPDDFRTQPAGQSGRRIACGRIR